jgi:hypothetical protein
MRAEVAERCGEETLKTLLESPAQVLEDSFLGEAGSPLRTELETLVAERDRLSEAVFDGAEDNRPRLARKQEEIAGLRQGLYDRLQQLARIRDVELPTARRQALQTFTSTQQKEVKTAERLSREYEKRNAELEALEARRTTLKRLISEVARRERELSELTKKRNDAQAALEAAEAQASPVRDATLLSAREVRTRNELALLQQRIAEARERLQVLHLRLRSEGGSCGGGGAASEGSPGPAVEPKPEAAGSLPDEPLRPVGAMPRALSNTAPMPGRVRVRPVASPTSPPTGSPVRVRWPRSTPAAASQGRSRPQVRRSTPASSTAGASSSFQSSMQAAGARRLADRSKPAPPRSASDGPARSAWRRRWEGRAPSATSASWRGR